MPAGLLLFDAHAHEHTSIAHTAFRVSGEDIDVIVRGSTSDLIHAWRVKRKKDVLAEGAIV